nr:uncharacterized protein LOC105866797 [Microcebus murinus]
MAGGAEGAVLAHSLHIIQQQPLAFDGGTAPCCPLGCFPCRPQEHQYLGPAGFPVSWRPQPRAQVEWARSPGRTQVVLLRAIVAMPELQLSTKWVDFGTCFVNQKRVREVYLMNLSGCQSYWTVLMRMSCPATCPPLPCRAVAIIQDPQEGACVPCPCRLAPRAGTPAIHAETASPPIPSDPRVARPVVQAETRGAPPRCGQASGAGGEGFPGRHMELPELACPLALVTGQQEPAKHAGAFRVSPSSGLLEAWPTNAPPTSVTLQVYFTARSSELYESMLAVEGVLGEEACALRLGAKALTMRDTCCPTSSEALPTLSPRPLLWNQCGPGLRAGLLGRGLDQVINWGCGVETRKGVSWCLRPAATLNSSWDGGRSFQKGQYLLQFNTQRGKAGRGGSRL